MKLGRFGRSLLRKPMEAYRGLHIGGAPGVHAAVAALVARHCPDRESVVDFGAHSGALLCRLGDGGFASLTGVDLDATRFDVPGAAFMKLDLNGPFDEAFDRRFSLITATDVVEHLDSPRAFLEHARRLLKDDGWIAIAVPNVAFWEGRIKFLLTGELWGFGSRNYIDQRHISPTTREQTILMMQEVGFEPVVVTAAGSFATPLRRVLLAPLWLPFRLMGGAFVMGECAVYLARKAPPRTALKAPTHYARRWSGLAASDVGAPLPETAS